MGRAERRREERLNRKMAVQESMSGYARAIVKREEVRNAKKAQLEKNGITTADLEQNYKNGYHDALTWATEYYQPYFYSAIAISLHNELKFGETRITRFLENVQQVMLEEISAGDIIERARRETKMDIRRWCSEDNVV